MPQCHQEFPRLDILNLVDVLDANRIQDLVAIIKKIGTEADILVGKGGSMEDLWLPTPPSVFKSREVLILEYKPLCNFGCVKTVISFNSAG
jgi:hypothetical protein